jgi:filamin
MAGAHKVNVSFAGLQVPKSPVNVDVLAAFDASACKVFGRGVQPTGVRMREKSQFYVITEGAGEAPIKITVRGPGETLLNST